MGLRTVAFVPWCVFAATAAAFYARGCRRFAAITATGLAFVLAFVSASDAVIVLTWLADPRHGFVHLGAVCMALARTANASLTEASYIAPVLLWFAARSLVGPVQSELHGSGSGRGREVKAAAPQ